MKPQMKQLHMTLAFQYEASSHDLLMKLAEEIKIPNLTHWQMKVYSRNPELKLAEVSCFFILKIETMAIVILEKIWS